jgi:hypothetical protein
MKILIQNGIFLLRGQTCPGGLPDKSERPYWNSVKRPNISDVQKWTIRFVKPDTPVLTGQKIMKELRKNLRS